MILQDTAGHFELSPWLIISYEHKLTRERCNLYKIMCNNSNKG